MDNAKLLAKFCLWFETVGSKICIDFFLTKTVYYYTESSSGFRDNKLLYTPTNCSWGAQFYSFYGTF